MSGIVGSEFDIVTFRVLGREYAESFESARGIAIGLLATCEKSELVFDRVFLAHTTIVEKGNGILNHQLSAFAVSDQIGYDDFVKVVSCPSKVESTVWKNEVTKLFLPRKEKKENNNNNMDNENT